MTLEKLFSEYVKNEIPSNPISSQVQPSYGGGTRIMSSSYEVHIFFLLLTILFLISFINYFLFVCMNIL